MAKKANRFNPFMSKEFEGFLPGGIPQYEMVSGVRRRNFVKAKKGKRIPGRADPMDPKKKPPRFAFAQMYDSPLGVGFYGGNRRMPNGEWMVRIRWDDRDPSLGWRDFQLTKLKPIWRAHDGKLLKCLWREEGHIKTKPKKAPPLRLEMVEGEKERPAIGSRVAHLTHGAGTVQAVTGTRRDWYAEVRFDGSPFGPLEHVHEYGPEVFYGPFFENVAPAGKRKMVTVRNVPEKYPTKNMGRSVTALEEARSQAGRDATEFYVTANGKRGRRSTRAKNTDATKERTTLTNEKI